jgi:hypothetical protein
MTMTRKDYIALAHAISDVTAQLSTVTHEAESYKVMFDLVDSLAMTLKADNANFDVDRFKTACWTAKV